MNTITLLTILSEDINLDNILSNAIHFQKVIIFDNRKIKNKLIVPRTNINIIVLRDSFTNFTSFSKLRNECISHVKKNDIYLFLDDDELISYFPKNLTFNGNGTILINNFRSVTRLFKADNNSTYTGSVHENILSNFVYEYDIKIEHKNIRSEKKLKWYLTMNDDTFGKLLDSLQLRIDYKLSSNEFEQILINTNLKLIFTLFISIKCLKNDHNLILQQQMKLRKIVEKNILYADLCTQKFLTKLINNEEIETDDILNQNIYQDKFHLLINI